MELTDRPLHDAGPPPPGGRPPIRTGLPIGVLVAWAAYAVAWLVPAVRLMPHDPRPMAGWQAFAAALTMAVRPDRLDWFWGLSVAGVLGNVAVLMTPFLFRRTDGVPKWFVITLVAAFAVNLMWIPAMSGAGFLPGFWLWIGAMGALAVAAVVARRR